LKAVQSDVRDVNIAGAIDAEPGGVDEPAVAAPRTAENA